MEAPWNNEAEQNLLSIFMSAKGIAVLDKLTVESNLREEDFYGIRNREIYSAILSLRDDEKPIDIPSLANKLNCAINRDKLMYLKNIAAMLTVSTSAEYYVKILKELTKRRKYLTITRDIQAISSDTSQPIETASAEIEKLINPDAEEYSLKSSKELFVEAYADVVDLYSRKGDIPGRHTPWKKLDKVTGGLGKGELIFIGARPGMGKSTMGQNIAEHIAFREREIAIIFSLEMPRVQVMKRILSSQTGVPLSNVKTGKLEAVDFQDLGMIANMDELKNLFIDENASDIEYIKAVCRMQKRKYKEIGVIVIDYLQLMKIPQKSENKTAGISDITRKLKLLAKELDCPIVVLSQLNRKNEREQDKRPQLSDLRDSGSIEQDADKVFLLYREAYYRDNAPKDKIDIIVAKSRDGQTGTLQLSWQPHIMRIMNPDEVEWRKKETQDRRKKLGGEQVGMNNQGGIA